MKLKYVQNVVEEVMKTLENINCSDRNTTANQAKVNKAYDKLFDFRKELIREERRNGR